MNLELLEELNMEEMDNVAGGNEGCGWFTCSSSDDDTKDPGDGDDSEE